MTDREFLCWIRDRLVYVHGENANYDYIQRLAAIAAEIPEYQKSSWP